MNFGVYWSYIKLKNNIHATNYCNQNAESNKDKTNKKPRITKVKNLLQTLVPRLNKRSDYSFASLADFPSNISWIWCIFLLNWSSRALYFDWIVASSALILLFSSDSAWFSCLILSSLVFRSHSRTLCIVDRGISTVIVDGDWASWSSVEEVMGGETAWGCGSWASCVGYVDCACCVGWLGCVDCEECVGCRWNLGLIVVNEVAACRGEAGGRGRSTIDGEVSCESTWEGSAEVLVYSEYPLLREMAFFTDVGVWNRGWG